MLLAKREVLNLPDSVDTEPTEIIPPIALTPTLKLTITLVVAVGEVLNDGAYMLLLAFAITVITISSTVCCLSVTATLHAGVLFENTESITVRRTLYHISWTDS